MRNWLPTVVKLTLVLSISFIIGFLAGRNPKSTSFLETFLEGPSEATSTAVSPLQTALGDNSSDLATLYMVRNQLAVAENRTALGLTFDHVSCGQREKWSVSQNSLELYLQDLEPYRQAFLEDLVGQDPMREVAPETVLRILVKETGDYRMEYIVFTGRLEKVEIHAYLLTPTNPTGKGVILLHPSTDVIESTAGLETGRIDRTRGAAIAYAQNGAIVLVPHMIENNNERINFLMASLFIGEAPYRSLMQRVLSSVDYLSNLKNYPISDLAMHGLSYGGFLAWWAGILDERVEVVAISNSVRDYSNWMYGSEEHPSLHNANPFNFLLDWCRWDSQNQLRFLLPKPLYIETSLLDRDMIQQPRGGQRYSDTPLDISDIEAITDEIYSLYADFGFERHFFSHEFEDQHVIHTEVAVPWVMDQLNSLSDD